MKILLSPAKKLDFTTENSSLNNTNISFPKESTLVMDKLSSYSALELSKLMKLSTNLSILNKERNDKWSYPFNDESAKQALFTFKGEVYQNMRVEEFSNEDLNFANKSIRILSGLYGILNPSDLILPYRLEMGTKLETDYGKNLYEFWGHSLTESLNKAMEESPGEKVLINLASNEYFKSVHAGELEFPVMTPMFLDRKEGGDYKTVSFYAKRARGSMASWIIRNRVSQSEQFEEFAENGYEFCSERSHNQSPVFIRTNS